MSYHRIPGGDRAMCIACERRLYVFNDSPWPDCDGTRDYPHGARPMTPVWPLTEQRPNEDVPAPINAEQQQLAAAA